MRERKRKRKRKRKQEEEKSSSPSFKTEKIKKNLQRARTPPRGLRPPFLPRGLRLLGGHSALARARPSGAEDQEAYRDAGSDSDGGEEEKEKIFFFEDFSSIFFSLFKVGFFSFSPSSSLTFFFFFPLLPQTASSSSKRSPSSPAGTSPWASPATRLSPRRSGETF